MKELIIKQFQKLIKKNYPSFKGQVSLEYPPDPKMGDLAFPCFELAKIAKKSPSDVAHELSHEINNEKIKSIEKAQAIGPYLNLFLDKQSLWKEVFKHQASGNSSSQAVKRVMLEFSQPNTNKPMHLGHMRNNFLGASLAKLLETIGHKIIKANLINDRGIHISKSMLAYQKVENGQWPAPKHKTDKGDHIVGDYYVLYGQKEKQNPKLIKQAQELLKKWEAGDKQTLALWKKMNQIVIKGLNQTYKQMDVKFDKIYYESQEYEAGKKIILNQLKKEKCYKRKDGAIEIDLTKYDLDKKVLLRSDGTSVYITQDIGLAVNRQKSLKLDKIIYVVGNEQDYHFKVLFKILELFGYKWAKNLHHLSYAMVNLTTGKMKSREGTVVDADDLIDEMSKLAETEIKKRESKISNTELKKRAKVIGLAAMKFYLLKHSPSQTITYNPKESISFEGATGPYIQYTYARIQSILRKSSLSKTLSRIEGKQSSNSSLPAGRQAVKHQALNTLEEWNIGVLLAKFNEVIVESTSEYNPATLCTYLFDLASGFNTFYHKHPVLKAEGQDLVKARLALAGQVSQVLKAGLELLGIKVVERM